MKMYYLKMLLFTFLINTLILPHYENYLNNDYNVSFIQNKTKRATIKSRLLAQTQIHNPHYHNDPELKEIIDKMNEEAIKKYQETHDPYKQLKEVVEKNGTKYTGGNDAEPMSTLEKELLETYEEIFGNESDMLKSGMSPNVDEKSSTCECTDINNIKLGKTKGRDKYLKHLKHRCIGGICSCTLGSALLAYIGTVAAKVAVIGSFGDTVKNCISSISILHMLTYDSMNLAMQSVNAAGSVTCVSDLAGATGTAYAIFVPCGITALVLLILAVVLIIIYIWLYRRRKRSWKHECKKHLCK
ncbi:stevor [Plasmodium falciparum NF54]|uniref:Stevor n=2 Tax=Plasmodium falciparum TaxID=5833 RepID=Q8IK43_PLAF7|nr:stevor [Plasmodium falciparum 3D7]KAF4330829.1 stevor [Plasmodium falciparum NF54]PKC49901.1 stevor [Plasmodium falciparum NF54]CZU00490.1 stevor [Plasmodium falciparum 3D7]|eukprot:XP_001348940.1 stevor [Plasmodium falciparum 3D7]